MKQMAAQAQMAFQQSQTNALEAQASESQARAGKYAVEAQLAPKELEIDKINAITRNLREGDDDDKEFERRMKVAETLLKEKEIESKNVNDTGRMGQGSRGNQRSLQEPVRQIGLAGEPGQETRGPTQ
jgi:hypothetical protein